MFCKPRQLLALVMLLVVVAIVISEPIDSDAVDRLCFPEKHKSSRRSCECTGESAPPWGLRSVHIDCSYKFFKSEDFGDEKLPLYVDRMDMSWNSLDRMPLLISSSLRMLNMMHNNISSLASNNFANAASLHELYFSWNSIQVIEAGAFDGLAELQVLDLSHNNLHVLPLHVFAPLQKLHLLSLSWNRQLNQTEGIEELNFYDTFGISKKLHSLKLEACSLRDVVLPERTELVELNLRHNLMTQVPPRQLPTTLKKLDLSENLFSVLRSVDTAHFGSVQKLLLEDMPHLLAVEENAFVPLRSLEEVSFQNSRRLRTFDELAFGPNPVQLPLTSMIFRGTSVRSFNTTLAPVFHNLTDLDLNGVALNCDCDLIWVKELSLETHGRCFHPSRLRGVLLSEARVGDFSCEAYPRWVYGIIVLLLMCLCAAGICGIVVGLRPHRRVAMRNKVGLGSPYARVTIEPNANENFY